MDRDRDCILCGKCLEACPLFKATGREELSPRGKSFLIQEALEERNLGNPAAARKLLGLCLGCGRCADVCPQGRNLPETLRRIKAGHPGWQAWVWRAWINNAKHVWPWLGGCAKLLPGRSTAGSLPSVVHALASRPQMEMFRRSAGDGFLPSPAVLFPGCMARYAKPWWIQAAGRIMGSAGQGLEDFPDWNCCGFTLGQAGLSGLRSDACVKNVELWRNLGRPLLLTICATCTTALRNYEKKADLFSDEDERRTWAKAVQPLSRYLNPHDFRPLTDACLTYHRPCHAPNPDPDEAFLRDLFGPRFIAGAQGACCGMGGVMRLSAPELSTQVATQCWDALQPQALGHVVSGCSGCVLQLSATAPPKTDVSHWLELMRM
ncbi:(Fe-S)-binding protein [Desulfonatronum thiosulfatophilum]|nr:(Fe-S)-binding protein [Desulfonatronum thiosulfatophilum]